MSTAPIVALSLHPVPWPREPFAIFDAFRRDAYPWLLDSALSGAPSSRFTFMGADPYLVMRSWGRRVELECRRRVRTGPLPGLPQGLAPGRTSLDHDPLEVVRALMPPAPPPTAADLPFVGGAVGYLGYELVQELECVELFARDDLRLPDLVLLFVDRLLILDRESRSAQVAALGFGDTRRSAQERADQIGHALAARVSEIARRPRAARVPSSTEPDASSLSEDGLSAAEAVSAANVFFDESSYAKAVESIRNDIEDGKLYQANLTHRMDLASEADPWSVYLALRRISPAPFAAYLELPEVAVVSSSPERFLRLDVDGKVESRPIKGTRPRGASEEEDLVLERALSNSAKDRAENLMIVDLMRNDLGRVCDLGSVEVPELWKIERYATLFQLVSTVTGRLREDRDVVDLLSATFPPGSMTGAPKIAAMRRLDSMEPVRRGVYSGALGYLDARGGADLSVVIRTLLLKDGRAYLHVGGGIVMDSEPVAEYRETLDKARALFAALRVAREAREPEV